MNTRITNQILSMIDSAKDKKRNLEDRIKSVEHRKDKEKSRLHRDEALTADAMSDPNRDTAIHLKMVADDKSKVMDREHDLAELRKEHADIDKKISEMNHWTGQSEYDDETKQAEALMQATKVYQTI